MGILEKGLRQETGFHSRAWRFWKNESKELPRGSWLKAGASLHCFEVEIRFKFLLLH